MERIFLAGLRGRCPACGEGALFSAYLRIAPNCVRCSADFSIADAGDGPAVFVIFIVGAIAAPLLLILQYGLDLPSWVALTLTIIAATGMCLALLPVMKSTLFALQWRHRASEARRDDLMPPPPA